jgi:hypothetical protein
VHHNEAVGTGSILDVLERGRRVTRLPAAVTGSLRAGDGDGHGDPRLERGDPQLERHLELTARWLTAAQDATPDDGVAGFFSLRSGRWSESYPETTGYIIPTLLALARVRGGGELRERALRMADWSCATQMDDGAVLSGLLNQRRAPAVFNTGQALFGWVAAHQVAGAERYARSAHRAAQWLLTNQDPDGAWRRNLSAMTTAPVLTYNVRCAWALAYAGQVLDRSDYTEAARLAGDWALAQQNSAGWYAHTAFAEDEAPLLHTISYVLEGLLGLYAFTGERRFLHSVERAIDPLTRLVRAGQVGGRLDEHWRAPVAWRCPTGEAQVAVVLQRLARVRPGAGHEQTAGIMLARLSVVQDSLGARRPSAGGVPGSFPVWGSYMRFALPNWAAKFYLDALLLAVADADEQGFPDLRAIAPRPEDAAGTP